MGIEKIDPDELHEIASKVSTVLINAFAEIAKAISKIYGSIAYFTISADNFDHNFVEYMKQIKKERYLRRYYRRGEQMRKHGRKQIRRHR